MAGNSLLNNENTWKLEEAKEAGNDLNPVGGGRIVGLGRPSRSSLLWAAYLNRVELIDSLLQQPNVDVNAKDKRGNTALHHAVCSLPAGNAIMPKLLAAPGILLNEENRTGKTPIMMAVMWNRIEAVQILAAVDEVDLDVRDDKGKSMEDIAWNNPFKLQILKEARQRR